MRLKTKSLVTVAVLLIISIILPTLIHMAGIDGTIFLPMHIPVLISGLLLGPALGFIVGIISPLINNFITGMPSVPILWFMLVELSIYGLMSGYLYRKIKMTLVPSLIFSMILGRIGAVLMVIILGMGFGLLTPPIDMYIKEIALTSLPGIIIQIIIIPKIVKAYEKNRIWE